MTQHTGPGDALGTKQEGGGGRTNAATGKARETAGKAQHAAKDTASEVEHRVSDATGEARMRASGTEQKVRSQVFEIAEQRKRSLVEQGRHMQEEAEKIADQLRSDGMDAPAKMLEGAASQAEDVISYVERTPVDEIVSDAGRTARRNPYMFMGAAFALGFASTRLLKAGRDDGGGAGGARFRMERSGHAERELQPDTGAYDTWEPGETSRYGTMSGGAGASRASDLSTGPGGRRAQEVAYGTTGHGSLGGSTPPGAADSSEPPRLRRS